MTKILLCTLLVVALSIILLSVRVILVKNGRFSSKHISQSKAMRERGIGCATSQHRNQRKHRQTAIDVKSL